MCIRDRFISVCNQPPKANSAFHPSAVGKWGPASAGKEKAGMVYSISGWTQVVQVKLWGPLRYVSQRIFPTTFWPGQATLCWGISHLFLWLHTMRAIPERLRGVFTMRHCTFIHVYLYLTLGRCFLCSLAVWAVVVLPYSCHLSWCAKPVSLTETQCYSL